MTPATSSLNSWTIKSSRGATGYKAVILAAPFHSTGIDLPFSLADQIPEQPYVHLHVTLLSTTSARPNSKYFNLAPSSPAPRVILTTNQGKKEGGIKPEFNSLTYHGLIRDGEWAVKIFSDHELSDAWLNEMFEDKIGWIYRKEVSSKFLFKYQTLIDCYQKKTVECLSQASANICISSSETRPGLLLCQFL